MTDLQKMLQSAKQQSSLAQEDFQRAMSPALQQLLKSFRYLLNLELQTTLNAGATESSAYIERTIANSWNKIGVMLWRLGLHGIAEALFKEVLAEEKQTQEKHGIRLHKGFSYHNLGICQVAQGNWEEGLQNIRRAVQEDIDSGVPMAKSHAHAVGTLKVFVESERQHMRNRVRHQSLACGSTIPPDAVDQLLEALDVELLMSLAYSVRTARTATDETEFGKVRRLNALRDASYLSEAWLRVRGHGGGGLKPCLDSAYGGCGRRWWQDVCQAWSQGVTSANTTAEAEANLKCITTEYGTATPDDLLARVHLRAGLMRNWTHHQFDPGASFLSGADYEELCDSIWVCLAHAQAAGV